MMQSDSIFRRVAARPTGAPRSSAPTNRAIRLRNAAELIADVDPPPLGAYPRVREVLARHTQLVCDRVGGMAPLHDVGPISDDFVLALRAEAEPGALSVSAALPLVTVAANLGELELLYPEPTRPVALAARD